jgi:Co/Zn/Cd efflux system component
MSRDVSEFYERAYEEKENGKDGYFHSSPNDQIRPLSPSYDEDAPDGVIIQAAEPLILSRRCCDRRSCCTCLFQYCPSWCSPCFCCCEEEEEKDAMVLPSKPSNEELLRIAFLSFLGFTICQCLAAIIARSNAMIGDSAAMAVDCFTYGFNLYAERKKQTLHETVELGEGETRISWERRIRKYKLQYESIPPLVSVVCLFLITSVILRQAIETITLAIEDTIDTTDLRHYRRMEYIHIFSHSDDLHYSNFTRNQQDWVDGARDDYYEPSNTEGNPNDPNVILMMIFSTINLFVDLYNVASFAKADHALGFNIEDRRPDANDANVNESGSDIAASLSVDSGATVLKDNKRKRKNGGAQYSTLKAEGEDEKDSNDDGSDIGNDDGINDSGSHEYFEDAMDHHQWSYDDDEQDLQLEGVDASERMKNLSMEEEDSKKEELAHDPILKQQAKDNQPQNGTSNVYTIDDKDDDSQDKNNFESFVDNNTNDFSCDEEDLGQNQYGRSQTSSSVEQANLNMCSAYTHVFVDTIRSMAVLIASLLAVFNSNITSEAADAAAAVAVSVAILIATIPLFIGLQKTGCELMEIRREEIMEREHSQGIELGWKQEENTSTNIV